MKILFVSGELIGSSIVHRLSKEGHELRLYIEHEDRKDCFDGIVEKVNDWRSQLDWVGHDGIIVFDDVVFSGAQEVLRNNGYRVVGGDSKSDKLELDRQFFHSILEQHGIPVLPSYDFESADKAEAYVKNNIDIWVVKQSSHIGMLNYVGEREDAQDVLDILQIYKEKRISPVHLQKRVRGVEIGVARYFNGIDWIGPIEINIEHKPLCNGDVGPLTAEMGTLMWYEENEDLPIYCSTLGKLKNYLKQIKYKGDIDINCIVNEEGIWPLEATMRFGTPSTEVQCELHKSPWGSFLNAIANGEGFELDYFRGYGVVISVAVPPFPYAPEVVGDLKIEHSKGTGIFFKENLTERELSQIHFEEVSVKNDSKNETTRYYLAGKHGYAMYVTGHGATVEEAQKSAYDIVDKIHIPKMFYRTDIGDKFIKEDRKKLKEWGWI